MVEDSRKLAQMVTGDVGGVKSALLDGMKRVKRKTKEPLGPVHPGKILQEDFLKPLGLTVNKLALELHVPARRIAEIVHRRRRVTADTALRLARYFNTNAEFWLNLQNFYELEVSRRSEAGAKIDMQVQPVGEMAVSR